MDTALNSPYERALGSRAEALHPVLREYIAAIPTGTVGIGEGVFEAFGTHRRWLAPVLAVLARCHIIVPGHHREVPFRIENRTESGRQTAIRVLELRRGPWAMRDAVEHRRGTRVVDRLGAPALVAAEFEVEVADGGLRLSSRAVRLGPRALGIPLPPPLRPRIILDERWVEAEGHQRVQLTMDLPLLGRLYEYRGTFHYRIEEEA